MMQGDEETSNDQQLLQQMQEIPMVQVMGNGEEQEKWSTLFFKIC